MSTASILAVVTGCLFVVTGGVKVIGLPQSLAIRDHFGMAPPLWRTIGVLETAGAVGVLVGIAVTPLGVAAATGLACLMVGAIASRLRVRDPLPLVLMDGLVLALAVTTGVALLSR